MHCHEIKHMKADENINQFRKSLQPFPGTRPHPIKSSITRYGKKNQREYKSGQPNHIGNSKSGLQKYWFCNIREFFIAHKPIKGPSCPTTAFHLAISGSQFFHDSMNHAQDIKEMKLTKACLPIKFDLDTGVIITSNSDFSIRFLCCLTPNPPSCILIPDEPNRIRPRFPRHLGKYQQNGRIGKLLLLLKKSVPESKEKIITNKNSDYMLYSAVTVLVILIFAVISIRFFGSKKSEWD